MTEHCVAGGSGPGGAPACGPLFHRWVRAGELVAPRTDVLPPLIEAVARRHGYAPAVAAALFWKQYAWYVVDAALRGWTTGPVPDLGLERTAIWVGCEGRSVEVRPGGPGEPAATLTDPRTPTRSTAQARSGTPPASAPSEARAASASVPASVPGAAGEATGPADREFTGWFRAEVVKGHLEPVLEHLHERTRAGRRLLWGSVAHAVALPLSRRLGDPVRSVPAVLDRVGPPVAGLVEVGPDGEVARRTCCLAFRMPTPAVCGYCPIRSADCSPLDRPTPLKSDVLGSEIAYSPDF